MKIFDRIYYSIYCTVVYKTKYADISQNYQESEPHRQAKQFFLISAIFYGIGFVDITGLIDFISERNNRIAFLFGLVAVIGIISFGYLSRKDKAESIVYIYNEKRGDLISRDGLWGFLYLIGSFGLLLGYETISYVLQK